MHLGLDYNHPIEMWCEPRGGIRKLPQAELANESGRRGLHFLLEPPLSLASTNEQDEGGAGGPRTRLPAPTLGRSQPGLLCSSCSALTPALGPGLEASGLDQPADSRREECLQTTILGRRSLFFWKLDCWGQRHGPARCNPPPCPSRLGAPRLLTATSQQPLGPPGAKDLCWAGSSYV